MAMPEPHDPVGFWASVKDKSIDQLWPPDDENIAWQLADQWRAAADRFDAAAVTLTAQSKAAQQAWPDVAGLQFRDVLRKMPENLTALATNMRTLAQGMQDYGNQVREARINILWELGVNIGMFAALMAIPGGGFLAAGLARSVAGRLTAMITGLAGRSAPLIGRVVTAVTKLAVEIGKETFDEAFLDAATQLTSMAGGTRENYDVGQTEKAAVTGGVGGLLGEGVGKFVEPLAKGAEAGLKKIMPDWAARNVAAGAGSFGNNAVTSPWASYSVENAGDLGALTDLGGIGGAIGQNGLAAGLTGVPRSMVIDGVQQLKPEGEALVNGWGPSADPPPAGPGAPPGGGLAGGESSGGAPSAPGDAGVAPPDQSAGGQQGGAPSGGQSGGAADGGSSGGGTSGGSSDGGQGGGSSGGQQSGGPSDGGQQGGGPSGGQSGGSSDGGHGGGSSGGGHDGGGSSHGGQQGGSATSGPSSSGPSHTNSGPHSASPDTRPGTGSHATSGPTAGSQNAAGPGSQASGSPTGQTTAGPGSNTGAGPSGSAGPGGTGNGAGPSTGSTPSGGSSPAPNAAGQVSAGPQSAGSSAGQSAGSQSTAPVNPTAPPVAAPGTGGKNPSGPNIGGAPTPAGNTTPAGGKNPTSPQGGAAAAPRPGTATTPAPTPTPQPPTKPKPAHTKVSRPPSQNGPTQPATPGNPAQSGNPAGTPTQPSGANPSGPTPPANTAPSNAAQPSNPTGSPTQPGNTNSGGPTNNGPANPPVGPAPTGTPGPRSRVHSVRPVPHSEFRVRPTADRHRVSVEERARVVVVAVAGDANVTSVKPLGLGRFLVTRLDGSTFVARVVAGDTTNGNVAEVVVTGTDRVEITVSALAELRIVGRAVANALAQSLAVLGGNTSTDNVLTGDRHPGSRTDLTAEDRGREAEARNLERARQETARVRLLRRRRLAAEMSALVEELGVHSDDGAGPQRQAVSDVRHLLQRVAPAGSRRPSWAGPPTGYPAWRAFLSLHLVADTLPGLGAATAIALTGAPLVGLGVGVMSVGTAVSGTIIKRWYGRRDKTLVDTGHGFAIRQRAYETALRRKQLLDPLLARTRATGVDITSSGPAEPAPSGDFPARYQSYGARLLARGGPSLIGAAAASLLMFTGLPLWNAATHWAVAGVAAALGPVAERYLRSRIVSREWALLDNVGREKDSTAAEFDEQFVAQLHTVMDRIDALAGTSVGPVRIGSDPVQERSMRTPGLRWYGANQAPGQYGDLARGTTDAASKIEKGTNKAGQPDSVAAMNAAVDALLTGGARATLGMIINAFLDRNFVGAEYNEIVDQVHFDFGNKMAEQVALEQQTLQAMLDDLNAQVDAAEAAKHRVQTSLPSRVAHLQAAPTPGDPAQRPRGHQRLRAFLRLHLSQAITMESLMVGAFVAFNQDASSVIVISAVSALLASNFGLRYLFRRSEQRAVDETIFADRAKERVVEAAETAARREFLTEFWTREITAAADHAGVGPPAPPAAPTPPQVPTVLHRNDPAFPDHIDALAAHERAKMMLEPRPWSLLGPRLHGLQRLHRLAARVREFADHERRSGESKPVQQARADLAALWSAYQQLVRDGTPMPDDHELVSSAKPKGMRGDAFGSGPRGRRLRTYLADSVATDGGRAFYDASDPLRDNANEVAPAPGLYTVDIHGGPDSVRIGTKTLTVADLAALLRADPNWHGRPIRLLACETGQHPGGFAQRLADELGVAVHAPSDYLGVTADGEVFVTTLEVGQDGLVRVVHPPTGELRVFEPDAPRTAAPPPVRNSQERVPDGLRGGVSGPRHWVYPSPVRQGAAWPHYGAVTIGPMQVLDLEPMPDLVRPPDPPDHGQDDGGGQSDAGTGNSSREQPGDEPDEDPCDEPEDEPAENTPPDGRTPIYSGEERLWPDELADLIAESPEWTGGPIRLLIPDGQVDPEFIQRLANLLGVPVLVPADSVVDGFPSCSSGTLEVYNEPAPVSPPAGDWRVVEPKAVAIAIAIAIAIAGEAL